MVGARKGAKRTRHNARKWILKALQSAGSGRGVPTSEIQSKVKTLSGSAIPSYSVYQALRTLTRRKIVSARRMGRELTFTLTSRTSAAREAAPRAATPAPMEAPPAMPSPVEVSAPSAISQLPHKLAPGEISILHISEEHVESATNHHGQLVIERHKRPSK
jgi:hypothetical protein